MIEEVQKLVLRAWNNGILDYAQRKTDEERATVLAFAGEKIEGDIPSITEEIYQLFQPLLDDRDDWKATAEVAMSPKLSTVLLPELREEILKALTNNGIVFSWDEEMADKLVALIPEIEELRQNYEYLIKVKVRQAIRQTTKMFVSDIKEAKKQEIKEFPNLTKCRIIVK